MLDQAHDLRQLAQRRERCEPMPRADRPAVLVVVGGKGGVGATAIALNLAHAMTQAGRQTTFTSADPLSKSETLLQERKGAEVVFDQSHADWNALFRQPPTPIRKQSPRVELIVVDAGFPLDGNILCNADAFLLVTTSETASVVRSFEVVKQCIRHPPCAFADGARRLPATWYLAVNKTSSARAAAVVHYRLARACRRLLGVELRSAGHLAAVSSLKKKQSLQSFGLNFPALSVDPLRRVLIADAMLNWRNGNEFDGHLVGGTTGRKEAKPSRRNSW
jgi:hypothetical protein